MKQSKAFIIVFTLMIVSIMTYLSQQLVSGVLLTSSFVSIVTKREQAKILALSGIQIAIKQLLSLEINENDKLDKEKKSNAESDDENSDEKEVNTKLSPHDKKFLDQILPFLNRWRTFSFDEKRDGFDAELKICLTCEEGKININEAFDFKKQEFKKEYAALLKSLEIKDKLPAGELATKLQEFLIKRGRKLEDISELAQLPACKNLDIFYKPPTLLPTQKKESSPSNITLALSDIFTIWTNSFEVDPVLFSDALCAIFTFRRPRATDPEMMKKNMHQFKNKFKPDLALDWDANWETLQLLYDKKPGFFKEMQGVFSKQFGPRTYSVISYATVGNVTQRVMAIIKKIDRPHDEQKAAGEDTEKTAQQSKDNQQLNAQAVKDKYDVKILRLYWL